MRKRRTKNQTKISAILDYKKHAKREINAVYSGLPFRVISENWEHLPDSDQRLGEQRK